MIIVEAVILANLPNKVFDLIASGHQECLFKLKELFLHIFGQSDIKVTGFCYQKELFVETGRGGESDKFKYSVETMVYLLLETNGVLVVNNWEVGVAYPSVD